MKEELLTFELAHHLFSYEDGKLFWKNPKNKTKKRGQVVGGRRKDGRQQVMLSINGKPYLFLIYRIIWLMHFGKWPDYTLDHIDGNCLNDKVENLRDVPQQQNNENRYEAQSNSKTGILGVSPWKSGFRATIMKHRKQCHLGIFSTEQEAEKAYISAKKEMHITQLIT